MFGITIFKNSPVQVITIGQFIMPDQLLNKIRQAHYCSHQEINNCSSCYSATKCGEIFRCRIFDILSRADDTCDLYQSKIKRLK